MTTTPGRTAAPHPATAGPGAARSDAARPGAARRLGAAPNLADLTPDERLSVDELRARQLDRLRWTLRHAYENVPFYRRKFDEADVHPDDCRELADLAKFPCTTKQDLRDEYPFGMFAVPQDQVRRLHASSLSLIHI